MITARFLPKYPKRIEVSGGLTKTESNGVLNIGFDYTDVDAAVAEAEAAANSAAASYNSFDSRYLGAKGSDPVTDNQGNPLVTGAQYWNTVSNALKVYNGLAWTTSAGGNVNGPVSSSVGNVVAFNSGGGDEITDTGINARSLSDGALLNAVRAAESTGSGVSADGRIFVDLLNSTSTLDTDNSSDYEFVKGGVQPTSAPGTYADAAYGASSSSGGNWTPSTIAITIAAAGIATAALNKDYLRITIRGGTTGSSTVGYFFVGIYGGTDSFDPAYPIVPIFFAGGKTVTMAAGTTKTSDPVKFSIPEGKALVIGCYVTSGYAATKTQTNWSMGYKGAVNEPAKITKSGYTFSAAIAFLERVEYASPAYANATVVSAQLPTSSVPLNADLVAFISGDTASSSDLALSMSRDGSTWKSVTWSDYYTFNGKRGIAAFGIDMTTGAGTGSALYWKAVTANNKRIKISDIGARQAAGVFTDVPSVPLVPSTPVVTHHMEGTGLGDDVSSGVVDYGWLVGFFQDWAITGPTRFHVKFYCNLRHDHPTADTAVAWTMPVVARYAVDAAAMGAKPTAKTDTDGFLNNSLNWLAFDSGNITSLSEHYKSAYVDFTIDYFAPGVYRFGVGGYSATAADSPIVANRIKMNWEESYGISVTEFKYNRLEIVATPLR